MVSVDPIAAVVAGHVDAGEPVEGSLQGEATLKRSLTATQLVMLGIGAVILVYCAGYFTGVSNTRKLPTFAAELVAFMAVMFGLVVSDNMLVMYVFWELTSVLSFLLVGHYDMLATTLMTLRLEPDRHR